MRLRCISRCRCAIASPSAIIIWRGSSLRLNSTGSRSLRHRRRAAMFFDREHAVFVVVDQLPQPLTHAVERQVVRRQHQRFAGRFHELVVRLHPVLQRVRFGLGRMHADVRRDDRQDLVAGNHHVERFRMQARVFRRMARSRRRRPTRGCRSAVRRHRRVVGNPSAVAACAKPSLRRVSHICRIWPM